jgi:hypothetical protein
MMRFIAACGSLVLLVSLSGCGIPGPLRDSWLAGRCERLGYPQGSPGFPTCYAYLDAQDRTERIDRANTILAIGAIAATASQPQPTTYGRLPPGAYRPEGTATFINCSQLGPNNVSCWQQ